MNRRGIAERNYLALGVMLVAEAAALSLGRPASATTRAWNTGDGSWNVAGNWSPAGVPIAGDTVAIGFGDGIARTVTYDYTGAPVTLNSLGLDLTGGSSTTMALSMSANNLTSSFEYVGYNGRGDFNQNGGTNTISAGAGYLDVGVYGGASGTYNLSGAGVLVANTNEYIGDIGTGIFNQMGGTNTISAGNGLYLAYNASGSGGTYNLSAGVLSAVSGEIVGASASGTFNQSGGTNTAAGGLTLGNHSGSSGTYTLSGGALSASNIEQVGFLGTGIFNQTGGTNSANVLQIGPSAGSGTYSISGGSATYGVLFLGGIGAPAILTVSGAGVMNITGTLTVSNSPRTALNLAGGTINAAALNFNGTPSLLNWTSGTLNLTTNVTWDGTAAGATTAGAFGPALTLSANQTLMVTGNETLGGAGAFGLVIGADSTHYVTGTLTVSPTGTITQDAGSTLYAATFIQTGGTVNGTLQNQGSFVYQSGMFSGRLLNQGTVNLGPSFTAGNGVENDASMTLIGGQTLTANGAGLDNLGRFTLSGGTISGAGPTLNDLGGTLLAYGTINPPLTNNGLLTVSGVLTLNGGVANHGVIQGNGTLSGSLSNAVDGIVDAAAGSSLNIANPWTNSGLITLQGASALLGGGAINNMGTVQGVGAVGNAVTNTGTIEPIGGTLFLTGTLLNPAGGLIRVGSGNKLLVTHGLLANAGIVNLTGGTFDNGGQPLNNMSQISGYGTFATGGTGLDNNGSITFSGGVTTVNGPVTNENGKTITIAYNQAIFTDVVTNNGGATFNTLNTTATFAGGFTNNGNSNFAAVGNGTIDVPVAPAFGNTSALAVSGASAMRFNAVSGAATVGTGVTATVSNSATIELAGSVAALSSGANRVNISNDSTAAAGILVSGTNQVVGAINGSGKTQVNAGSDLTANHIIQGALVIGGAAGNPALVTIDASDANGNPLDEPSGFALADSLTPSGPFGEGVISSASLSSIAADSTDLAVPAAGNSIEIGNPSSVPEPSALLLTLLAVLGVISTQFVRHHFRCQTV